MAHRFKSSDFGPLIGESFHIQVEGRKRPVTADLVEVKIHQSDFAHDTSHGASLPRRGFSLLFRTAKSHKLEQNTYTVKHKKLGKGQLFLTPVDLEHGGRQYEAVFNFTPNIAHDEPHMLEVQETGTMPLIKLEKPKSSEKEKY